MGDKHLFKKKKNDDPETIAPELENAGDVSHDDQEQETPEFVYGMEQQLAEESETDVPEQNNETNENIIECDSLVKIYKTDDVEVMALQGLELNIKYGELMAVIGKSGSGKSTLLNMIGGLERPTAGKLYVDGKDLFAMTDKELVEKSASIYDSHRECAGSNVL